MKSRYSSIYKLRSKILFINKKRNKYTFIYNYVKKKKLNINIIIVKNGLQIKISN